MGPYQYQELESSPKCVCANSMALETGETGLYLLWSTHMKLRASTDRRVYGIVVLVPFLRREEMETGTFSFTHPAVWKQQARLQSQSLDVKKRSAIRRETAGVFGEDKGI